VGAAHPAALTFRNGGSAVTTLAAHRLMSIRDSALVRDAIHHDISRCDRPGGQVQALINLQSSADDVDPEMDFSVGAVHFHRVRTQPTTSVRVWRTPAAIVNNEPVEHDGGSAT
jgi:hypothetical protein